MRAVAEEVRSQRDNMPPDIAESAHADELDASADEAEGWLEGAPDHPER